MMADQRQRYWCVLPSVMAAACAIGWSGRTVARHNVQVQNLESDVEALRGELRESEAIAVQAVESVAVELPPVVSRSRSPKPPCRKRRERS